MYNYKLVLSNSKEYIVEDERNINDFIKQFTNTNTMEVFKFKSDDRFSVAFIKLANVISCEYMPE
jgi:hypothetical protein